MNSILLFPLSVFLFMTNQHLFTKTIQVNIDSTVQALIREEDTDADRKITIDDFPVKGSERGDKRFLLKSINNETCEIYGTYYLSNLLEELFLQKEQGKTVATLTADRIFENPVHRVSRMIKDHYWDGLTRRIDAEHLMSILSDEKISIDAVHYLYVSHLDTFAYQYFKPLENDYLKVIQLPEKITPEYVKGLEGRHGLLALKLEISPSGKTVGVPFVVPGGRFNEMYGWDSYFESLGLIADGKIALAKSMVDQFVYEIDHYGKILNANRSYYLTRSQPPFLTSMGLAVYHALPDNQDSKAWLKTVLLAAIREYRQVWMSVDHLTETGLNRYYGAEIGIPPEVEQGQYDFILKPYAKKHGLPLQDFISLYQENRIHEPELDTFFMHDRAVRESGHDTTYRWRQEGRDRCADFVTVDLNALLYKYEIDIAMMLRDIFQDSLSGETYEDWAKRAEKRKKRMLALLWNPEESMFFDYDVREQKQSDYISATMFYPLWACHPNHPDTRILSDEQADQCIRKALTFLESAGGVLSSARQSVEKYGIPGIERQWDYPFGWAPHQMLIWQALLNYSHQPVADRLIYKWLFTITSNAAHYNGTIPEKYNVVTRSHKVFAEYGNVGTQFSYMTKEGFGWMNASCQVGLGLLSGQWQPSLEKLIPPEWIEFEEE